MHHRLMYLSLPTARYGKEDSCINVIYLLRTGAPQTLLNKSVIDKFWPNGLEKGENSYKISILVFFNFLQLLNGRNFNNHNLD